MYIKKDNLKIETEENSKGISTIFVSDLADFDEKNSIVYLKLNKFKIMQNNPRENREHFILICYPHKRQWKEKLSFMGVLLWEGANIKQRTSSG